MPLPMNPMVIRQDANGQNYAVPANSQGNTQSITIVRVTPPTQAEQIDESVTPLPPIVEPTTRPTGADHPVVPANQLSYTTVVVPKNPLSVVPMTNTPNYVGLIAIGALILAFCGSS